jgi:hypothetical protein
MGRVRIGLAMVAPAAVVACHGATRADSVPSDRELVALCTAPRQGASDFDDDGLPDDCEQELAERFAPVVYHSLAEMNFPTNVDRFLDGTTLAFFDASCTNRAVLVKNRPRQEDLLERRARSCDGGGAITSDGTRSRDKRRSFFLADVAPDARAGSAETRDWKTYVHAYRNDVGGVTVQYWRLYAYNTAIASHGGDWEGIHVVLDAALRPALVRMLQHSGMVVSAFEALEREGTHVRVFSEVGGHATRASGDGIVSRGCGEVDCAIDTNDARTHVRQETWSGGEVRFPGRAPTSSGGLVNVGEKRRPMNGQRFIAYSGLWGSPGALWVSSGYWGPAFNETELRDDGFVTAWCAGMIGEALARECYPTAVTP